MKHLAKRGLAMLTAFVLVISLMPAMHHHTAHAADTKVEYVYSGNYIYNWGTRGELATFLSPKAEEFYTGNYTYDALSSLAGGTSTSNAPDSALFDALYNLMAGRQTYETSYDATKTLFQYTDCEGSAKTSNKISSFYSGTPIGPSWDGSWNREHCWPNSKSSGGSNSNTTRETDIMMLRPTSTSENSSRGNTAYGASSGFYNPNEESNGKYDLRGDVARIVLYVYVRWGGDATHADGALNYMWGSSGVIESLDVLLDWMEADPVDTWELGRNDSTESIIGTRNVFVDYPELAFRLFGAEIPQGMTTPSGSNADHTHDYTSAVTAEATCTTEGVRTFTCSVCSYSYTQSIPAIGHDYVDGICTLCGEAEPTEIVARPVTSIVELSIGDQIIIVAKDYNVALSTTQNNNNRAQVAITKNPDGTITIAEGSAIQVITLEAGKTNGTYAFNVGNGYLHAASSSANYLRTESTLSDNSSWKITITDGTASVIAQGSYTRNVLQYNQQSSLFSCYGSATQKALAIYVIDSGSGDSEDPECPHTNTTVVDAVEATCTTDGYTGKTVCSDCDATVSVGEVIPALGHNYVDGTCTRCGEVEPSEMIAVLVTDVTKLKAGAQIIIVANAANYALGTTQNSNNRNAVAITKNADGTITVAEDAGIQIITLEAGKLDGTFAFNVGNGYLYAASSSKNYLRTETTLSNNSSWLITISNGTTSVVAQGSNTRNALKFNSGNSPVIFSCYASGQQDVAIYMIGGGSEEPACEHTNTTVVDAVEATCTTDGYTGNTVCADCDEPVSEGEVIPALGHNYVDGVCTRCGAAEPTCKHTNTTTEDAIEATCTTEGHTGKTVCADCGETVSEGEVIGALGHNYVDGVCTRCGAEEPVFYEHTIDLTTKDNRTVYTNEQQVWKQNGITVTNDKAASTNNVGDYAPARFYKSSKLTIEHPGMTKIVFNCNSYKDTYAADLVTSIGTMDGVTATADGAVVTVVFAAACDSFVIEQLAAQVRVDSITVTSNTAPCQHTNTTVVDAVEAKCTTDGHTGKTVCADCGVTVSEGDVIPALGHNYVDGVCTRCGAAEPTCKHTNTTTEGAIEATCTTEGHTGKTICSDCGETVSEGEVIRALGHNYVDGKCTRCGEIEVIFGVIEAPVAGNAYKFGMIQKNKSETDVYYLTGAMSGYYMATTTDKDAAIDVYLEETTGGYYLYTMLDGVKTYINMVVSGTHVNGAYETTASTVYTYNAEAMTIVAEIEGKTYWFGTRNDKTYTTVGPVDVSYNGFYCKFYGEITEDVVLNGIHKDEDGTWRYYVDGVHTDYTGLVEHTDGKTYYVFKGVVPMDYVGLYNHTDGKIYYIYYGVAVTDYVGLYAHTNGVVYYIDNGTVSSTYTGLYAHSDGNTYYVYNGVIPTSYIGLCYHTDGKTYYIYKGVAVSSYTGLYNHTDGKVYYINAGVIDPTFIGLYTHTTGATYYVYNGVVLTDYVGLYLHTDGYVYYVYNGVLVPSYEGFYFHSDGKLYYMYEGVIAVDYTGLALHTDGKLYYVVSGVFDATFNGTVTYNGTQYEVVNGIAQP